MRNKGERVKMGEEGRKRQFLFVANGVWKILFVFPKVTSCG
jgi:hypothetical protein